MKTIRVALLSVLLHTVSTSVWASKPVANFPYVHSGLGGRFYVRCIPDDQKGEKGSTILFRVNKDEDVIVDQYDWYSPKGVILGWSPIAGKVAIMRRGGQSSQDHKKQVEFSFYIGGEYLKIYTTHDLMAMGAKVSFKSLDGSKRPDIEFLECQQIPRTNEYVFRVKISDNKTIKFDILTGELYKENVEQENAPDKK